MAVDIKQFKGTLAQFPTGVCVVTTKDNSDVYHGITVNSFNSVSLSPPLILWSINKGTHNADAFSHAKSFVVNILAENQVNVSNQFASNVEDRFAGIQYSSGLDDNPILDGVVAYLQCQMWQVYDGGDHLIIVGEVVDAFANDNQPSLLYYQGQYAKTTPITH